MIKNIFKILAIVCLLLAGSASAHQPNYVEEATWVKVSEPEISKAFYGSLPGKPARYVIATTTQFSLYAGILVPDLPEISKNISAIILYQDGSVVGRLNGDNFGWTPWYEEYAGDNYFQGPEFREIVPAGTYTIIVYSPKNDWDKYVLVIGEKEVFPIINYPEMEKQIYQIKTKFFNKSWYSIFQGRIGKIQFIFLFVILFLIIIGPRLLKKLAKVRR